MTRYFSQPIPTWPPHFVRFCQLVRRVLVRWMAGVHARRRRDLGYLGGRARVLAVDDQRAVGLAQARGDPHPGPACSRGSMPSTCGCPRAGQPGADQMHGVVGPAPRSAGWAAITTVELVPDRAKAELGFQASECRLDIRDPPVGSAGPSRYPSRRGWCAAHRRPAPSSALVVLGPALESAHGRRVGGRFFAFSTVIS